MPLDPQARRFLDLMAATRGGARPPTPIERRQAFKTLARMAGGDDISVGAVENTKVLGPGGPVPIRVYTPTGQISRVSAAMVYFHGGGWVIGDLDTHNGICSRLAEASG